MDSEKAYKIDVGVETAYLPEQSSPEDDRYVFSYTITIHNSGTESAKLVTRHWIITDGNEKVQEVHGEGVVGEQPRLEPGKGFVYTSGTMMETPVGHMRGSYQMIADDGTSFDAEIPMFTLSMPNMLH